MNNGIDEIKEIEKTTEVTDPFDEELEDNMIINDTYFLASRDAVTLDGMQFSFMKPPYMNFEDHIQVKRKLKEAFTQQEILLIYGYSGVGKTTVLTQFQEKYPYCIYLIKDFTSLSPSNMIVKMGECIGLPLKQRSSKILVLQERLRVMSRVMFLFDEVSLDAPGSFNKLEYLRKIYMETGTPVCICGVPRLYNMLYDTRRYDKYCSLITRLDEHEMRGMRREDAGNYLNMIAQKENHKFTYPAEQALIRVALCTNLGGIHAFTTIIGRCIPTARGLYYKNKFGRFPDNTQCIRPASPDGKEYPGAELVLVLPVTPEPVLIDETMVSTLLGEYKSHFPKDIGMNIK